MTTITKHMMPGDKNADLFPIFTADEQGNGGAHHHYRLVHGDTETHLKFQNGGVSEVGAKWGRSGGEVGANGITEAQLIAILIHRLECFQAGPFRSRENAITITKLEEALLWLHCAPARGIEGQSVSGLSLVADVIPGLFIIPQMIGGGAPQPVLKDHSNVIDIIMKTSHVMDNGNMEANLVFSDGKERTFGVSFTLRNIPSKINMAAEIACQRAQEAFSEKEWK